MPALFHPHAYRMDKVATRTGPRTSTRYVISVPRPLVAAESPDYRARGATAPALGYTRPFQPATPFRITPQPTRRIGTVLKGAPGHQGSGIGTRVAVPGAGFQATAIVGPWTPLESMPPTRASFQLDRPIPQRTPTGPGIRFDGAQIGPSYHAYDTAPAQRQFHQHRSSVPWAQASTAPQFRPLTPSQQASLLQRTPQRRTVMAGQSNPNLYTAGYPTRVGVAARIGGGPVAVLGYNSQ